MVTVGLVVNPNAARDIRRVTSLARTIDVHERVNVVARVLHGLASAGVRAVRYLPEPSAIVEQAAEALAAAQAAADDRPALRLSPVAPAGTTRAVDAAGTAAVARALASAGAACVVTLGGDGTNRAVARGWPDVRLLPLPGGTNNALALSLDPTAAGLAAGLFASDPSRYGCHSARRRRLDVDAGDARRWFALVDVALVGSGWVGAHAVWDPDLLLEAVVVHRDPSVSGLAGLGGMLWPSDGEPRRALHVRFGPSGTPMMAPLAPGRLVPVRVRGWSPVGEGEPVTMVAPQACTLAFDGEREAVLRAGERVTVRVSAAGPFVVDAVAVLRDAARDGWFARGGDAHRRPHVSPRA